MKIFDTSVWIDYLLKNHNLKIELLVNLLKDEIAVFTFPAIIQEVLQGNRDDEKYENFN